MLVLLNQVVERAFIATSQALDKTCFIRFEGVHRQKKEPHTIPRADRTALLRSTALLDFGSREGGFEVPSAHYWPLVRFLTLASLGPVATIIGMAIRSRKLWLPLAVFGLALCVESAQAQFNPRGRKRTPSGAKAPASAHPKPAPRRAPQSTSPADRAASRPTDVSNAPTASQDAHTPSPNNKPSNDVLIARYTAIALQQPGVVFPLQRLSELYRERDGHLDSLKADFDKRLTENPDSLPLLLGLAWLAEGDGARDQAEKLLSRAQAAHPKHAAPALALANLREAAGDKAGAAAHLERALPLQDDAIEKEQTLRRLRSLALDVADLSRANKYHEQLVRQSKGSIFVRSELGKELLERRMPKEAVEALQSTVKAAQGDNRALAPALRDLAKAQAANGTTEAAIQTLERAASLTAADSGTHREILDILVETYRSVNRVPDLVVRLERDSGRDPGKLFVLASLYEEAGRLNEALATHRRALSVAPGNTDIRLKLIHLLELRGDLSAAAAEYRYLIKANPRNPEFVFQLADLQQKLGNPKEALSELNRLSDRSKSDPEVLAETVDFYERIGESQKALELLEKLVAQAPRDYQHLIALGERYFAAGDERRAETTWRKLLEVVPDRARAEYLLGEVYLEHDLTTEALQSLNKACELAPQNAQYKKTLALALERTGATSGKAARLGNYAEAQSLWEKILTSADSPAGQREARQHITTLWSLQGSLKDRVAPLENAFRRTPPHLASGRMLAEVYQRLNQLPNAERVLRELLRLTPNDIATWTTLERVLVAERKLPEAVDVAKKLVELEPKRALDHYQRLARYSADLYRDDEAIAYAAKAVALSPDDAEGQKRLGDMYRRRQDIERAVVHYRLALSKNDRLFPAYFDLAELLLLSQRAEEADHLLRTVVRTAVDEEVIARAARLSMQLHVSGGGLEKLEQELLPLSLSRSNKPVYRSLLLELYNAWMLPLMQRAKNADSQIAAAARAQLVQLGQRSVKPLLDALSDAKTEHQRTAIELLSQVRNPNANLPLFTFATNTNEVDLQARAMLAIGMAGASNVAAQLEELLFSDGRAVVDESSPLALAAAWSYSTIGAKNTTPKLLLLAESDSPTAQVFALVALSQRRESRVLELIARRLADGGAPTTRAAAAFAIGELGAHLPGTKASSGWGVMVTELRGLSQSADPLQRASALVALARLQDPELPSLFARALIEPDPALRELALRAAAYIDVRRAPASTAWNLPVPQGDGSRVDAARLLEELLPPPPTATQAFSLLPALETELIKESRAALQRSDGAVQVISRALTIPPVLGWHPLTALPKAVSPELRSRAAASAARIAAALTPEFVVQSTHPDVAVRTAAVRVLTTQTTAEAREAVESVFTRGDEETCRAVLAALVDFPNSTLLIPVSELLSSKRPWPLRQLAARTLRDLASAGRDALRGSAGHGADAAKEAITQALETAARDDSNAFVREQAVIAWVAWAGSDAKTKLTSIAQSDPEVRVRKTAEELLQDLP